METIPTATHAQPMRRRVRTLTVGTTASVALPPRSVSVASTAVRSRSFFVPEFGVGANSGTKNEAGPCVGALARLGPVRSIPRARTDRLRSVRARRTRGVRCWTLFWGHGIQGVAGRGARVLRGPRGRQLEDVLAGQQGHLRAGGQGPDGVPAARPG